MTKFVLIPVLNNKLDISVRAGYYMRSTICMWAAQTILILSNVVNMGRIK